MSVRLAMVFCDFVICSSPDVTMVEMMSSIPVATTSSIIEKPD